MALLKIAVASFPPWIVGIIGATGVLTALVPGSLILVTASTLLARNLVGVIRPGRVSEEGIVRLAKIMVPVVAFVGAYCAVAGNATIVALLLMGYAFVTQLFPAMIMSLLPRNPVTKEGAATGIILGVLAVIYFTETNTTVASIWPGGPEVLRDLNIGTWALIINVIGAGVVSALTAPGRGALARGPAE